MMVQALHESYPNSRFFSACEPDVPCITPGTYAFLGAGAALSGIMHITISVTVIMFELTGALTYILPTMIVVGVTKAVGDRFSKGGIADRMIWFNGFPFLDSKEEHYFGVPVSQVMISNLKSLPAAGFQVQAAQKLLDETTYSGFPVVENATSKTLVGYIGRTELQFAIDRARKRGIYSSDATCVFTSQAVDEAVTPLSSNPAVTFDNMSQKVIDFSAFVDATPITVHPRLPLETVMELFKKMGPRVILVDHHGTLEGLVTVKDCLKYQFKVEALEHQNHQHENDDPRQEKLWEALQRVGGWIADRVDRLSRGRLKFRPRFARGANGWARAPEPDSQEDNDPADDYRNEHAILDGTEDIPEHDHDGLEMDVQ
jgi:chloride channel 3/4/5